MRDGRWSPPSKLHAVERPARAETSADFRPLTGDDAYLPLKTLSSYAGLSVRTLRAYLSHTSYPLPCYRIGGKILVRRSDYNQWTARFRAVAPTNVDALVSAALRGL